MKTNQRSSIITIEDSQKILLKIAQGVDGGITSNFQAYCQISAGKTKKDYSWHAFLRETDSDADPPMAVSRHHAYQDACRFQEVLHTVMERRPAQLTLLPQLRHLQLPRDPLAEESGRRRQREGAVDYRERRVRGEQRLLWFEWWRSCTYETWWWQQCWGREWKEEKDAKAMGKEREQDLKRIEEI